MDDYLITITGAGHMTFANTSLSRDPDQAAHVRLVESLFPEAPPFRGDSWIATGTVPELPRERVERPKEQHYAPPPTAPPPG